MKLLLRCPQCAPTAVSQYVEMNYEGVYQLDCPSGHRVLVVLPLQKFEILFQMGSLAFLDGYPREAALDFAAALERFFEFAIMVMLSQQRVPKSHIKATWKHLSHQSERQLGAFYTLYLHSFAQQPPTVDNKWVSFRNSVTHRGEIPSVEKTEAYASYLWQYMINLLAQLKTRQADGLRRYVLSQDVTASNGTTVTTADIPTMISVLHENVTDSFADSLAVLRQLIEQGVFRK
ncbi:MAG: hypothetical protein K0Q77_2554 [Anaerosporomusa subterranea]|jgi:hypothetical protein|nr:hypothetical protein [Anaerosporomusa subterranea]